MATFEIMTSHRGVETVMTVWPTNVVMIVMLTVHKRVTARSCSLATIDSSTGIEPPMLINGLFLHIVLDKHGVWKMVNILCSLLSNQRSLVYPPQSVHFDLFAGFRHLFEKHASEMIPIDNKPSIHNACIA